MLDIGVVLQAPTQDREWLKKCALFGLLSLGIGIIPLVGPVLASLNALGWMRAYCDGRRRGETEIPAVKLGYIGAGWSLVLMMLPLAGILIAAAFVVGGVVALAVAMKWEALAGGVGVVGGLLFLPAALWLAVFQAGIYYLFVVKQVPWASVRFGAQWDLAKRTGTNYLLLWVSFLVAGIVGQLGAVACLIGLVVSLPYYYLMLGAALAEFARVTNDA
jgi:hypothetical protein